MWSSAESQISLDPHASWLGCKTAAKTMALTFQLLGPIDAHRNGQSLPLSGPRRRALLARLLVARGQLLTADQLVDDVWDGQPSAAARATLQSHISQLRKVL